MGPFDPPQRPQPDGEGRDTWPTSGVDWAELGRAEWRPVGDYSDGAELSEAAAADTPEAVAELVRRLGDANIPDEDGFPPLYAAVRHGRFANAEVLLRAGADPAASLGTGGTVGRLALVTPLAPLFEGLPGVEPLTEAERAAQEEADRLIRVFQDVETLELGAAFVAGLDEEEVIRRLGARPEDCPVLDLEREPGPYGTGLLAFGPESLHSVGVTAVPGGCVVGRPGGHLPSAKRILLPLSRGTVAAGIHFSAKGWTDVCVARDGEVELKDEIFEPTPDSPPGYWLYRFWDASDDGLTRGNELAFLAGTAGVRPESSEALTGSPRRWVRVPEGH